jgi:hypothetical protein
VKPNLSTTSRRRLVVSLSLRSLLVRYHRWAVILERLLSHVDRVWQPKRILKLFTVSQSRGKLPSHGRDLPTRALLASFNANGSPARRDLAGQTLS